jgi:lysozyme family protein
MEEPTNTDSKLKYCVSSLDQILLQNSTIASQDISTKPWFKTQLLHLKKSQPNFDSKFNYCISRSLDQILIQNSTIASPDISTKSWFKTQLLHLKKSQLNFEAILHHANSFGWDTIERIQMKRNNNVIWV